VVVEKLFQNPLASPYIYPSLPVASKNVFPKAAANVRSLSTSANTGVRIFHAAPSRGAHCHWQYLAVVELMSVQTNPAT
jgi:hypothetical protein